MELNRKPPRRHIAEEDHYSNSNNDLISPSTGAGNNGRPHVSTIDGDDAPTAALRGGWTAAKQQVEAVSDYAQTFKPETQTQIIKFLEDAPYANFRRHWMERSGPTGLVNRPYVCLQSVGKPCPLCDMGDKPQVVSAFNIAVIGDDGHPSVKSWEVGIRLFNVLNGHHTDPKTGPLTRAYFGVSKTSDGSGARRGGMTQTNVWPIPTSALLEQYGINPPTAGELADLTIYGPDIIRLPKRSELEEIAEEMASEYRR